MLRRPAPSSFGGSGGAGVGAVAGAAVGKTTAEAINPQDAYWRANYLRMPGYIQGYTYDDYLPAYRLGYEGRRFYQGMTYDQMEAEGKLPRAAAKRFAKLGTRSG